MTDDHRAFSGLLCPISVDISITYPFTDKTLPLMSQIWTPGWKSSVSIKFLLSCGRMEQRKFNKYSVIAQAGAWLTLYAVMFLDSIQYDDGYNGILYATNFVLFAMIMVYVHYQLVLPVLIRGYKWTYGLLILPYIFLLGNLAYLADTFLPYDYAPEEELETYWGMLSYTLPVFVLLLAGSGFYYFVELWFKNIKKEAHLRNEKLEAELNFLKSQINPHFLFNTLNNIYSYVQTGNEKSGPMLERLSSVLRFMVYDCSEEKVELQKELDAVEDLLVIHKMKNSGQENIRFEVNGVRGYHLIAPLIIVNLVENACKHSDAVSNPEGFIDVKVSVNGSDECLCEISNSVKVKTAANTKYGGVGLDNVIQRLELQYEDQYSMEKVEEDRKYYLKVKMPLERKR